MSLDAAGESRLQGVFDDVGVESGLELVRRRVGVVELDLGGRIDLVGAGRVRRIGSPDRRNGKEKNAEKQERFDGHGKGD
jgi:hypothetical protein